MATPSKDRYLKKNIRNQPNVPSKPPVKTALQPGSQQDQLDRIEQQMKEQIEQMDTFTKEQREQKGMLEAILKHLNQNQDINHVVTLPLSPALTPLASSLPSIIPETPRPKVDEALLNPLPQHAPSSSTLSPSSIGSTSQTSQSQSSHQSLSSLNKPSSFTTPANNQPINSLPATNLKNRAKVTGYRFITLPQQGPSVNGSPSYGNQQAPTQPSTISPATHPTNRPNIQPTKQQTTQPSNTVSPSSNGSSSYDTSSLPQPSNITRSSLNNPSGHTRPQLDQPSILARSALPQPSNVSSSPATKPSSPIKIPRSAKPSSKQPPNPVKSSVQQPANSDGDLVWQVVPPPERAKAVQGQVSCIV